ncbi:hypothetical protein ACRBEJ_08695 [Yersinia proxima]|uniref:hypothetical protein n=1 Tax=Yersinia proxima TaxID=2890316 RepID=UPI003D686F7B
MIAIPRRIKRALDAMEAMLHIHKRHFGDTTWSTEVKWQIEGMRIANKTKAIICHDRILNGRKC